jgi:hypothetical protein
LHPIQHGHTHEHLEHPGKFAERDLPDYSGRDWVERGFTVGIGGCVRERVRACCCCCWTDPSLVEDVADL